MKKTILALLLSILGLTAPLSAEVMTYQGRLKESNVPVNANRTFLFEFCATETPTGCVPTADGAKPFAVQNGLFKSTFTLPAVDLSAGPWYLRVQVEGSYLSPVERLTFVPYSVFATSASYAGSASALAAVSGPGVISSTHVIVLGGLTASDVGVQSSTTAAIQAYALLKNNNAGAEDVRVGVSGRVSSDSNDAVDIMAGGNFETEIPINKSGEMIGVRAANRNNGGSSSLSVGVLVDSLENSGTINETYGVWIATLTQGTQASKPYALYAEDPNARSYFAGNVGISSRAPAYALSVSSASGDLFWVADDGAHGAKFWGDGSGLTGVTGASGTDSSKLPLAGGTMTGSLLMDAGSTITVTGSAFSVGGSTLVVQYGRMGIGIASPAYPLEVAGIVRGTGDMLLDSGKYLRFNGGIALSGDGTDTRVEGVSAIAFRSSFIEKMRMTAGGEFGIGTVSPEARLDVVSTATANNAFAQIWRTDTGIIIGSMSSTGSMQAVRFVGDGSGITGLGSAAAAGTATNLSGGAAGEIPYQSAANTTAMLGVGSFGQLLASGGAGAPSWTSAPAITGGNITGIDPASLAAGSLPGNVIASSIAINSVYDSAMASPKVNRTGDTMTGSLDIESARLKVIADTSVNQYSFAAGTGTVASHLYVSTSGNVGLGITNPGARLTLPYNGYIGWDASDDGSNYSGHRIGKSVTGATPMEFRNDTNPGPAGRQFSFFYSGVELLTILNGGDVGIGKINPAAMLDVAGSGSFSGSVTSFSSGTFRAAGGSQFSVETSSGILVQAGRIQAPAIQLINGAAANYVLTSDAAGNAAWGNPASGALGDGWVGNEITDAGDTTLTRSGLGTSGSPYLIAVNLGNSNTWTGAQTFSGGLSGTLTGNADTVTNGVYTTISYADPAWVASLGTGKINLSTVTARLDTASVFIATATSRLDAHLAFISTATPKLDGSDSRSLAAEAFISTAATAIDGKMLRSGDFMSGQLTNASSVTITGNGGAYGLEVSSNISLAGALYTANGYVGIGSSWPAVNLDVVGQTMVEGSPVRILSGDDSSQAWKAALRLQHKSDTVIAAGSSIGISFEPLASTGSNFSGAAAIKGVRENATASNQNTALTFWTRTGASNVTTDTEKMRITSSGNVGIYTGAPQARLDVLAAGSASTDMAQIWRNSGGTIVSSVSATGVAMAAKFVGDGSGLTAVAGTDVTKLPLAGGFMSGQLTNTSSVTITGNGGTYGLEVSSNISLAGALYSANGNVGIGTLLPQALFEVSGAGGNLLTVTGVSANARLRVDALINNSSELELTAGGAIGDGWSILRAPTTRDLEFRDGGSIPAKLLLRKSDGNVGIATTAPDQKLTVAGNISQTGNVISSGTGTNYFAGNTGVGIVPLYLLHLLGNDPTIYLDNSAGNNTTLTLRSGGTLEGKLNVSASGGGMYLGTNTGHYLGLHTAGTERIRVAANGNVGISDQGTASYNFHVASGPAMAGTIMAVSTGGVNVFSVDGYGVNALRFTGNGSGLTGVSAPDATKLPLAGGTMAGTLAMGGNHIYSVSTITASGDITAARYQINGSTMVAILPGTDSVAYGLYAGASNITGGDYNVFIGNYAGTSNTTGIRNTANGSSALYSNTTGIQNTANGSYALYSNTAGNQNTANGSYALYSNTTASQNTANGHYALYSNTTGNQNTANGYAALFYNTTGRYNTANGYYAVFNNQTGAANSVFGFNAGGAGAGGVNSFSSSTIMGYQAGYNLTTGSDNTFLGWQSGYNVTTGTGNIVIGYDKGASAPAANNELNIGGVLYGDLSARTVGISTRVPHAALDVVSTGTASNIYAQIWRDSTGAVVASMTSTGHLAANTITASGSLMVQKSLAAENSTLLLRTPGGEFDVLELVKYGSSAPGTIGGISLSNLSNVSAGAHGGALMLRVVTANPMYFLTNNLERIRIDSSGHVGIGVTAPGARLEVKGETSDSSKAALSAVNSAGTSLLNVRNDGYVGIGTANPGAKFEVKDSAPTFALNNSATGVDGIEFRYSDISKAHIKKLSDTGEFQISAGAESLVMMAGGSTAVVVQSDGNVGIGMPPSTDQRLVVNGGIRLGEATTPPSEGTIRYSTAAGSHFQGYNGISWNNFDVSGGGWSTGVGTIFPGTLTDLVGVGIVPSGHKLQVYDTNSILAQHGIFSRIYPVGANLFTTSYGVDGSKSAVAGLADSNGTAFKVFGVAGYLSGAAQKESAGVFGAADVGTAGANPATWGALGYRDAVPNDWAGYFNGNIAITGDTMLGNTATAAPPAGTLRSNGGSFQGYTGSRWRYFEMQSGPATLVVAAADSLNKQKADYICTGTNDQVEINAAIGALTVGGVVQLLEGSYYLGASILVNKDKMKLAGAGKGTLLRRNFSGALNGLLHITVSNVEVENLSIRNFYGGMAATDDAILINASVDDVSIREVYETGSNSGGYAIETLGAGQRLTVKDSSFDTNGGGIFLSGTTKAQITGNTLISNYPNNGIYLLNSNFNTVSGNTLADNNAKGIQAYGSHYNTIAGNTVTGLNGGGISLTGAAALGSSDNIVSNNTIYGFPNAGIEVVEAKHNSISGNKISDCGGAGGLGIQLFNSDENSITSNVLTDAAITGDAVTLDAVSDNNFLAGNVYTGYSPAYPINDQAVTNQYGPQKNGSNYIFGPAGNVGIGTKDPAAPLHIASSNNSAVAINPILLVHNPYSLIYGQNAGILFGNSSSSSYRKQAIFARYTGATGYSVGELHFAVNGVDDASVVSVSDSRMMIDKTGKVGIGTSGPAALLDVNGTVKLSRQLSEDKTAGNYALTAADFGKTLTTSGAVNYSLPADDGFGFGGQITFVKLGPATVTIIAPVGVYIADSGPAGTIYNNLAAETYATVTLRQVDATHWVIIGGDGNWTTTL